ncbi:MAG: arylsulfotransferase family protein, partial [Solirubrobacteraceae bacterium]
ASFVPKHSFKEGESVALEARVEVEGHADSVGTIFHVERTAPASASASAPPASAPPAPPASAPPASAPPASAAGGAASTNGTEGSGSSLAPSADDYHLAPQTVHRGPEGTAWVSLVLPVQADLAAGGAAAHGALADSVIEELDLRTGLVMWEWHALGHVPLSRSTLKAEGGDAPWNAHAIDSIEPRGGGALVVSMRNASTRYEVEIHSGAIRRR